MSFATEWKTTSQRLTTRLWHSVHLHTASLVQRAWEGLRRIWNRLQPRSLRHQLIAWTSGLVVILFASLSLITYLAQARMLRDNAQQTLDREVSIVQSDIAHQIYGSPPVWPDEIHITGINPFTDPGLIIEIHDTTGNLRWTTDINGNTNLLGISGSQDQSALVGITQIIVQTVSNSRMLVEIMPLRNQQGQIVGVAHVARSLQEEDAALGNLRNLMILASIIALLSAVAGGWYLTRQALLPLSQIARVANNITQALTRQHSRTPQALRLRVPPVEDTGELGALVTDVNHMLDALASYDAKQRQFITDASHELRTPLTTIRGNLELVRRMPDLSPDDRQDALRDAASEADRMTLLINDLLTLARAESSGNAAVVKKFAPVEIDSIVVEVFRLARERVMAQNMTDMTVKIDGITPALVSGDPLQLRQLLLILVDNALKYAPQGSLTLGMQTRGEKVQVTVSDTGPGISPEDLPHIFDRFYRASRERDREGSGLGLSIANTLVDQHGGTIEVASQLGKGTTFTITLPQVRVPRTTVIEEPVAAEE